MAHSVNEETDLFQCCICMNDFNEAQHKPKMLPCHHTFCSSCIDSIIKGINQWEKMACPLCAETFSVHSVDSLKTNVYLQKFKEALGRQTSVNASIEEPSSMSVYLCSKHGNTEKFFWCFKCSIPVCVHCLGIDHRNTEGHVIKDIGEAKTEIIESTDYKKAKLLSQIDYIKQKKEEILGLRNSALQNATIGLKTGFEAIPNSIRRIDGTLLNPGNKVSILTNKDLKGEDIISLNRILLELNSLNDFMASLGNTVSQKYAEEKILSQSSIMVSAIKSKIKFDYGRIYCMRCGEMCNVPKKISAEQSPYNVQVIEHKCQKCKIMVAQFY